MYLCRAPKGSTADKEYTKAISLCAPLRGNDIRVPVSPCQAETSRPSETATGSDLAFKASAILTIHINRRVALLMS